MEASQRNNATSWADPERSIAPDAHDRSRRARTGRRGEAYEQQIAKEWVREHQDVALLAAFALGVFMGAWMRG